MKNIKTTPILLALVMLMTLSACRSEKTEEIPTVDGGGMTVETRFPAPPGYERAPAEENSLLGFLRGYKLKEDGASVLLYNGKKKHNQNAHSAVFDLPIEDKNLQQCADSVMRIYAEYYWHTGRQSEIAFHFTDGFLCEYSKWIDGFRPIVGQTTRWEKKADFDDSYEGLVKYLHTVFAYAGTASMEAYETETIPLCELGVGDVILKGGSPGHVVMAVDICENKDGKKAFLFAQGYMPAQEFHIIKNPAHMNDSWYYEEEMDFPLKTAEYTFDDENMIKRIKLKH